MDAAGGINVLTMFCKDYQLESEKNTGYSIMTKFHGNPDPRKAMMNNMRAFTQDVMGVPKGNHEIPADGNCGYHTADVFHGYLGTEMSAELQSQKDAGHKWIGADAVVQSVLKTFPNRMGQAMFYLRVIATCSEVFPTIEVRSHAPSPPPLAEACLTRASCHLQIRAHMYMLPDANGAIVEHSEYDGRKLLEQLNKGYFSKERPFPDLISFELVDCPYVGGPDNFGRHFEPLLPEHPIQIAALQPPSPPSTSGGKRSGGESVHVTKKKKTVAVQEDKFKVAANERIQETVVQMFFTGDAAQGQVAFDEVQKKITPLLNGAAAAPHKVWNALYDKKGDAEEAFIQLASSEFEDE